DYYCQVWDSSISHFF
nr:immunoglobulin light chain junction region [Macaca mulatta]MOX74179.1 immunoglobulin light chain junction region [Macaca mulatta]MOX75996.1 immunoglobulin light chain junction region [Macaca mulatta]MOX76191.1 immunoglobulin light chain junction region [Macaca mulatta]MOX76284.1 immunoglobulin light chain junction region [Macaca mulatta]